MPSIDTSPQMVNAACGGFPGDRHSKIIVQTRDAAARNRMHDATHKLHGIVTAELPIIDGFVASVPDSALPRLDEEARRLRQDVRIIRDQTITLDDPFPTPPPLTDKLYIATRTVHIPDVWAAGFKGKGIGIAIVDTGIAPHPDVADRIVAFTDIVNGQTAPYDDRGHGTHVAGIAAGSGHLSSGKYAGAAPEASLIGIKVMNSQGSGQLSDIIKGIQWAVDNKEKYNIRVINMSLGAKPQCSYKDDIVVQATTAATRAGMLVVAAAGNKGPYPHTIDSPATSPYVLAVGATVDYSTIDLSDDKVAWYSGTGPTSFDGFTKPDVVVPGTNIICPDGATNKYVYDTGTSMASPLVAGIAALMIQAKPNVKPWDVKKYIMQGAQKIRKYDENIQGKGVVMADKTLHILQESTDAGTTSKAPQTLAS